MSLDEFKSRVVGICELLGGSLPYEVEHLQGEDWASLSEELRRIASDLGYAASQIVGYAGSAALKSKREQETKS